MPQPCIIEFSGIDQGDHGIGRVVDRGVAVVAEVRVMVRQMICRLGIGNGSGFHSRGTFGRLDPWRGSIACTSCRCRKGSDHCVRFSPFPQLDGKDGRRCTKPCWRMPSFTNSCWRSTAIWRRSAAPRAAPECGGVLHTANYPRKPRGRPVALGEEHDRRFSFCCAVDGCRNRATPASLRFLGRKVYLAVIVTLIAAMRDGLTERRVGKLAETIGVDRRTVARWRDWWLARFTATPFWRAGSAGFMPPVDAARLPAALLERFAGERRAATDRLSVVPRADHRRRIDAGFLTDDGHPQRMHVGSCRQRS